MAIGSLLKRLFRSSRQATDEFASAIQGMQRKPLDIKGMRYESPVGDIGAARRVEEEIELKEDVMGALRHSRTIIKRIHGRPEKNLTLSRGKAGLATKAEINRYRELAARKRISEKYHTEETAGFSIRELRSNEDVVSAWRSVRPTNEDYYKEGRLTLGPILESYKKKAVLSRKRKGTDFATTMSPADQQIRNQLEDQLNEQVRQNRYAQKFKKGDQALKEAEGWVDPHKDAGLLMEPSPIPSFASGLGTGGATGGGTRPNIREPSIVTRQAIVDPEKTPKMLGVETVQGGTGRAHDFEKKSFTQYLRDNEYYRTPAGRAEIAESKAAAEADRILELDIKKLEAEKLKLSPTTLSPATLPVLSTFRYAPPVRTPLTRPNLNTFWWIPGRGKDWNTIEGMIHGGWAAKLRQHFGFASPWQGLKAGLRMLKEVFSSRPAFTQDGALKQLSKLSGNKITSNTAASSYVDILTDMQRRTVGLPEYADLSILSLGHLKRKYDESGGRISGLLRKRRIAKQKKQLGGMARASGSINTLGQLEEFAKKGQKLAGDKVARAQYYEEIGLDPKLRGLLDVKLDIAHLDDAYGQLGSRVQGMLDDGLSRKDLVSSIKMPKDVDPRSLTGTVSHEWSHTKSMDAVFEGDEYLGSKVKDWAQDKVSKFRRTFTGFLSKRGILRNSVYQKKHVDSELLAEAGRVAITRRAIAAGAKISPEDPSSVIGAMGFLKRRRYRRLADLGEDMLERSGFGLGNIKADDDFYNSLSGMDEGGLASLMRKLITDFGSGFQGDSGWVLPMMMSEYSWLQGKSVASYAYNLAHDTIDRLQMDKALGRAYREAGVGTSIYNVKGIHRQVMEDYGRPVYIDTQSSNQSTWSDMSPSSRIDGFRHGGFGNWRLHNTGFGSGWQGVGYTNEAIANASSQIASSLKNPPQVVVPISISSPGYNFPQNFVKIQTVSPTRPMVDADVREAVQQNYKRRIKDYRRKQTMANAQNRTSAAMFIAATTGAKRHGALRQG